MVELFQSVSYQTQMGQMLDLLSQPQMRRDPALLRNFTLDNYHRIVTFKTAIYTFNLPIHAGMLLCGYDSAKQLAAARAISIELGKKFQIEDDFLDCYGLPEKIGKDGTVRPHTHGRRSVRIARTPGNPNVHADNCHMQDPTRGSARLARTLSLMPLPIVPMCVACFLPLFVLSACFSFLQDIKDHKCSWLIVQALERVTPAQRTLIETHYGKDEAEHQQAIKQLYNDLNLKEVYDKQEDNSKARIEELIQNNAAILPPSVFLPILRKIHNRDH
jgi:geranylgeranyl pyrophosphate synthase